MQAPGFLWGEAICWPQGVNSSRKQGFIGIHIADAGDNILVNQDSFKRRLAPSQELGQHSGRKARLQRLGAKPADNAILILDQLHLAKFAGVAKEDTAAVIQVEHSPSEPG
jgi:hypothetical protein